MSERKLATIRMISEILPIDGADAIELAVVDGWKVVIKKGEYKTGDICVYCEVDSFLPIREEFEFLRKSSYKKLKDGTEGFRLKTIKLRGQISQGLILPLEILEGEDEMKLGFSQQPHGLQFQLGPWDDAFVIEIGADVTELLGITKYEPPIPAELAGKAKGNFPAFLRKTDEERIQNLTKYYEKWKLDDKKFYATEKLDGSSATFYYNNGVFGVCSRNLDLLESEGNTFWKVARQLNLEEKLKSLGKNVAVQGELIGEGIQGNPYNIKGQTVKFFNVFDIDACSYYDLDLFLSTIQDVLQLETVPVLDLPDGLPATIEELLKMAEGKSVLNPNFDREGLVIRSTDRSVSFKAISNKFLLNEK